MGIVQIYINVLFDHSLWFHNNRMPKDFLIKSFLKRSFCGEMTCPSKKYSFSEGRDLSSGSSQVCTNHEAVSGVIFPIAQYPSVLRNTYVFVTLYPYGRNYGCLFLCGYTCCHRSCANKISFKICP